MAGFIEPEEIVQRLDVQAGMKVADFGSGSGYFSIPLARLVGDDGKVYALDIQKDVLETVKSRAKTENLLNIETVWANLELPRGSKLDDGKVDLVIISNILFQAEDKGAVVKESARILKPGGSLVVFEWDETASPPGPPLELRIGKSTVRDLTQKAGFSFSKDLDAGSHHYGLIFKK